MRTAQVTAWGEAPKYIDAPAPAPPAPDSDFIQVKLIAAGMHRLVKYRAKGMHYSAKTLPHIPGTDGVGTTAEGDTVYFSTLATGGSFSEYVNVPKRDVVKVPEGVEPIQAAALVNPALSSWMALRKRTEGLENGFTALILGVTGASGSVAVEISRAMGAGKVIGIGRNVAALEALDLDERVVLKDPVEETDYSKVGDVDVILDYLWGPPVVHLLNELKTKKPVQFLQIGSMAGWNVDFPAATMRSKDITFRGSGPGAWTLDTMGKELPGLLEALRKVKSQKVKVVKLEDVEKAWGDDAKRMVFVP